MRARMQETSYAGPEGVWAYRAALPCAALAGVARLLWDSEGAANAIDERILPTSDVVLIVDRRPNGAEGDFVCGLQRGPIMTGPPARPRFTGVRLTPLGAFKAFGAPARELAGEVIDLDDLVARDADRLRDQLMSEPNPARRLAALEAFLVRRIARGPLWHDAAVAAWVLLKRFHGAVRMNETVDAAGVSARQLGRIFHEQIGMSPKTAARLLRFERVLELIRTGGGSLADIAAHAGYADQAHLTREFRDFAGASPTDYRRRRMPAGDPAFMRD